MAQKQDRSSRSFRQELRFIGRQGQQVWRLVPWPQRLALGGAVLIMGVASAANTAIPLCLGRLVDAVNPESHLGLTQAALTRVAAGYLAIIGGAYVVREALNVLRRYLVENTCTRIDRDMCVQVVAHLMKVELSELAYEQVGSLHGRITRSVDGLVRFLRLSFLDFIPALMTGGFALGAALSKEPRIALAMVGVVPISVALTMWQLITQKGVRLGLMRSREAMDGTVVEQLGGMDYVRAANTHRQEVRRVERAAERRRAKEFRHHFEMSLFGCGKALNEGFFHLLVIASAIYLFVHGGIRYGDILTFSVLYMNVMAPLNEVHRFVDEAHESSLKVGDLVEILSRPIDPSFEPVDTRAPRIAVGAPLFSAQNLVVNYRTADGKASRALNKVSLAIRHGETIGVAGRSGCGKSTLIRVLMRLTHPSGGAVEFGGVPLECITRDEIGKLIGYVGQNPFIFSGLIAENIAYGCERADDEDIVRAARMACIHDEIEAMPDGYDSVVAERGQNLSGGQRQRIALARVFLKNPPVLILDEGTSALDNISERRVQEAINAARSDRTVILVAHRLTTLLNTDRIFVFDEGRIVETGTYEDLVDRGGTFSDLVRSAAREPSLDRSDPSLTTSSRESINTRNYSEETEPV
jgi:ATP-binding cassette subfamily B protein